MLPCILRRALGRSFWFVLAALCSAPAPAMIITVGQSGIPGNCTRPTLDEAMQKARENPGPDEIWVTNDVQPGTYDGQHLTIDSLDVDIIGGFDNCWSPSPTGRTRITGDGASPVLKIRGSGVVNLKQLEIMDGGSGSVPSGARHGAGVDYSGRGSLLLEDVILRHNVNGQYLDGAGGLSFEGTGGIAHLQFLDDVSIDTNFGNGAIVFGSAVLTMDGTRNTFKQNRGAGLRIESPAVADIGAAGDVFEFNETYGVEFIHHADTSGPMESHLYAASQQGGPGFRGNRRGAIQIDAPAHSAGVYTVCVKGANFREHVLTDAHPIGGAPDAAYGSLVRATGPLARLQMETHCVYPPAAGTRIESNAMHDNVMAEGKPLIAVGDGAIAIIDRAVISDNTANAIFSANLGRPASSAGLHVYNALVFRNILRDDVFEALHGAFMSAVNLTAVANDGTFGQTLLAIDAAALGVLDSIIDQPQPLLQVEGSRFGVNVQRVLARNRSGTSAGDVVIEGRAAFDAGYGLLPTSLGVDVAPAAAGDAVDLYGRPRSVDTAGIPNVFGSRDLGAVELQLADYDTILADGFDPAAGPRTREAGEVR
ncbi:MAG: hypothetical protein ACTHK2_03470 [Dokdonella sp.]|uniref:hypothetical protein n=1 Tax=Dokdonella sp. TaxID=2291710 RepID=UPI003F7CEBFA